MDSNMQQQILNRLDAIAAKLGVAANYLFALYVRQTRISAMEDLAGAVVGVMVLAAAGWGIKWSIAEDQYDREGLAVLYGFMIAGALVAICVFTANFVDLWFNPQFWAFRQILSDIK